ncbi:multiple epidermal growth factor-like domains protein 11 [Mya arenaria]|uniref:multiple epidermal growth factor-like domains protein 11 n=1 Tax=Mya arenaria TaxID=6604 RepID=UPI0022E547A0|nr:multiple epidermal growth factor-like domains protein 11 [Mya arenaria]
MVIYIFAIILYFINAICGLCLPGKHGDSCSYNCTYRHCFCSSERACEGCEIGYWDRRQNCELQCISLTCRCTNITNCLSCKDGSYGLDSKCDKNCSSGCASNICYNNGTCFRCKSNYTGNTCDSCEDGLYGANCSLQCSQGCEGRACSSRDGTCNCNTNYRGEKCDSCIEGRYGLSCSEPCNPGCVLDDCTSINGNCDCKEYYKGDTCDVCVDGRYGHDCLSTSLNDEHSETDGPNFGAAVGGVVGAVLVVIAVVVFFILSKQRSKLCCNKPRDAEQISGEIPTSQPVVFAAVSNNGVEKHERGPYETLKTTHTEESDRSDTYTGLFTTGQAGATEGVSPDCELDISIRNPGIHLYANTMLRK